MPKIMFFIVLSIVFILNRISCVVVKAVGGTDACGFMSIHSFNGTYSAPTFNPYRLKIYQYDPNSLVWKQVAWFDKSVSESVFCINNFNGSLIATFENVDFRVATSNDGLTWTPVAGVGDNHYYLSFTSTVFQNVFFFSNQPYQWAPTDKPRIYFTADGKTFHIDNAFTMAENGRIMYDFITFPNRGMYAQGLKGDYSNTVFYKRDLTGKYSIAMNVNKPVSFEAYHGGFLWGIVDNDIIKWDGLTTNYQVVYPNVPVVGPEHPFALHFLGQTLYVGVRGKWKTDQGNAKLYQPVVSDGSAVSWKLISNFNETYATGLTDLNGKLYYATLDHTKCGTAKVYEITV